MEAKQRAKIHLEPFLTESHEVEQPAAKSTKRPKWRFSLLLFILLTAVVLLLNIIFLIYAATRDGINDGKGTLYSSSCANTRRANIGVHLVINVLSSLLLGASNYCMQCLSAPSRKEVDLAHAKGTYLDIGVPSLHNVWSGGLAKGKKICWWLLLLSSLPLHLCYNSVIFPSLSAQTYGAYQFNASTSAAILDGSFVPKRLVSYQYTIRDLYSSASRNNRLERLDPLACIDAYGEPFQSSRGNVFLIAGDDFSDKDFEFDYPSIERTGTCSAYVGTEWIYNQFRSETSSACFAQDSHVWLPRIRANASDWRPFSRNKVQYCLSERTEQQCKLNFSLHLLVIVIVFNVVKMVVIICSLRTLRDAPLLTVGDAVTSFLKEPDVRTSDLCLVGQSDIHHSQGAWTGQKTPRTFTNLKPRWISSIKKGKLRMCIFALTASIALLLGLFIWSYTSIQGTKSFSSVLSMGLGAVDARTLIQSGTPSEGTPGILANVFLANSPQVLISLVYFSYNSAITSMLLAQEWSSYSLRAQGLRVSSLDRYTTLNANAASQTHQRSTYFLQLPWSYGAPLLLTSILLHWLASQSIFVIAVELYNMFGAHSPSGQCFHFGRQRLADGTVISPQYCGEDFVTCAYSPLGILLAFVVAVVMAVVLGGLGSRKLGPSPIVGSCSVAIAASCHVSETDGAVWEQKVRWGVDPGDRSRDGGEEVGHCSMSSGAVESPLPGRFYI